MLDPYRQCSFQRSLHDFWVCEKGLFMDCSAASTCGEMRQTRIDSRRHCGGHQRRCCLFFRARTVSSKKILTWRKHLVPSPMFQQAAFSYPWLQELVPNLPSRNGSAVMGFLHVHVFICNYQIVNHGKRTSLLQRRSITYDAFVP